ncbi:MAG TPA: hypothetical protein VF744_04145 [Beijerinckiaceae bacterium]|jgi:hypothetical protein
MHLARRAEQADLVATVRFRTEAEGGRKTAPTKDSLSAIMTVGRRNFDVRLQLANQKPVPGQEAVILINFLNPRAAREFIKAGQRFTLRDWRVIAEGTVDRADFPPG